MRNRHKMIHSAIPFEFLSSCVFGGVIISLRRSTLKTDKLLLVCACNNNKQETKLCNTTRQCFGYFKSVFNPQYKNTNSPFLAQRIEILGKINCQNIMRINSG